MKQLLALFALIAPPAAALAQEGVRTPDGEVVEVVYQGDACQVTFTADGDVLSEGDDPHTCMFFTGSWEATGETIILEFPRGHSLCDAWPVLEAGQDWDGRPDYIRDGSGPAWLNEDAGCWAELHHPERYGAMRVISGPQGE